MNGIHACRGKSSCVFQVCRQPGQIEIQTVTEAEIHQADPQKIEIEYAVQCESGGTFCPSLLDDVQFFRSHVGMLCGIIAKPSQPENAPDHPEQSESPEGLAPPCKCNDWTDE